MAFSILQHTCNSKRVEETYIVVENCRPNEGLPDNWPMGNTGCFLTLWLIMFSLKSEEQFTVFYRHLKLAGQFTSNCTIEIIRLRKSMAGGELNILSAFIDMDLVEKR